MTRSLTFQATLEPGGIRRDRRVEIAADGTIVSLADGAPPYDGYLALPGMPNAHSHAFQRALVGRGEAPRGGDSFWTWRKEMYRLANAVDPEDVRAITRQASIEMLRGGFTRLVEFHYLHHGRGGERGAEMAEAVLEGAADAGLPTTLLPVYYRRAGFSAEDALPEQHRFVHRSLEAFLEALEGLGELVGGVAPHSLRAVPPEEIEPLVEAVDRMFGPDLPLHIHVSEQTGEVEECRERFGRTPVELLFEHVTPGPRWNLVHATHATADERAMIRDAGANVVLCPLTEAYLGDGIFDAHEHLSAGGSAAVGTDSNVRISVIEELRTLEYGQRLRDRMRARLGRPEGLGAPLWTWLASSGGLAAGEPIGSIEVGRRADLVVLDEASPVLAGHEPETALDGWLVGGGNEDIAAVYVAGTRLVDHGCVGGEGQALDAFAAVMGRLSA